MPQVSTLARNRDARAAARPSPLPPAQIFFFFFLCLCPLPLLLGGRSLTPRTLSPRRRGRARRGPTTFFSPSESRRWGRHGRAARPLARRSRPSAGRSRSQRSAQGSAAGVLCVYNRHDYWRITREQQATVTAHRRRLPSRRLAGGVSLLRRRTIGDLSRTRLASRPSRSTLPRCSSRSASTALILARHLIVANKIMPAVRNAASARAARSAGRPTPLGSQPAQIFSSSSSFSLSPSAYIFALLPRDGIGTAERRARRRAAPAHQPAAGAHDGLNGGLLRECYASIIGTIIANSI